jgi:serine/threonine protein kinase
VAEGATVSPGAKALATVGDLPVGTVVKGRFEIGEELGRGGMGVVYLARDLRKVEAQDSDPFVAIKILSADLAGMDRGFIILQREAKHAQTLSHPNIVKVFDFDRDGPLVFLTMELLRGESLQQRMRDRVNRPLRAAERLRLARGILAGVSYAHAKGIVHADLKPSNVFVCSDGEPKILDFGIARRREHDVVFDADELGAMTVDYASAEMLANERPMPADDVFALGCILFVLYAGRHPFDHKRADEACEAKMRIALPKELSRVQGKALQKSLRFSRNERFEDAAQFAKALEAYDSLRALAVVLALGAALALLTWSLEDHARSWWTWVQMDAAQQASLERTLHEGWGNLEKEYLEDATIQFVAALRLDNNNAAAREGLEAVVEKLQRLVPADEYATGLLTLRERAHCAESDADCPEWVRAFFTNVLDN